MMRGNRTLRSIGAAAALVAAFFAAPQAAAQGTNACAAEVIVTGRTCIGDTITLTMAGHADCRGCLVGSLESGPTMIGNLSIPVASPGILFVAGLSPKSRTMTIPNDPILQNATFYLASVLTDGNTLDVSPGVAITICPAGGS